MGETSEQWWSEADLPTPRRRGPDPLGSGGSKDGSSGSGGSRSSSDEGHSAPPAVVRAEMRIRTPSPEGNYYSWRGRDPPLPSPLGFLLMPVQLRIPSTLAPPESTANRVLEAGHSPSSSSSSTPRHKTARLGNATSSSAAELVDPARHSSPARGIRSPENAPGIGAWDLVAKQDVEPLAAARQREAPVGLVESGIATEDGEGLVSRQAAVVTSSLSAVKSSQSEGVVRVVSPEDSEDDAEQVNCDVVAPSAGLGDMDVGSWPSVGSVGHPQCRGPPCKYNTRSRGCKDGDACSHCHMCVWKPPRDRRREHLRRESRHRKYGQSRKAAKEAAAAASAGAISAGEEGGGGGEGGDEVGRGSGDAVADVIDDAGQDSQ